MKIKHLKHTEINFAKWDNCISQAVNSLVYAESWYLNAVSPNWEALIYGDYEAVMPLPVKRKFGIAFLVQPPLTQQLGVFSKTTINEEILQEFIRKIPYLSYHLCLNEQNKCKNASAQPNYVLDLNKNFEKLYADFSKNTKRNIEKTSRYTVEIRSDLSANDFLKFYYAVDKNYSTLSESKTRNLIEKSIEKEKMTIYGAYNFKNNLISALCLLHSKERIIYLLPVSNEEGKEVLAMFKIVDEIIQKYADKDILFDFAGSSIQGIARFYQGFGAEAQPYSAIKRCSIADLVFWK